MVVGSVADSVLYADAPIVLHPCSANPRSLQLLGQSALHPSCYPPNAIPGQYLPPLGTSCPQSDLAPFLQLSLFPGDSTLCQPSPEYFLAYCMMAMAEVGHLDACFLVTSLEK